MGRLVAPSTSTAEVVCWVESGSDGEGSGTRGRGGDAGQGYGGGSAIFQCGSGEEPGSLSVGEALSTWAGCASGGPAAAADSGGGGEEEEREASLCSGQHGERPEQSRQGFYALSCEANINPFIRLVVPACHS